MRGIFITFEGGEGSGKTTQIQMLAKSFEDLGFGEQIVLTREPGGTEAAEAVRDLLVRGTADRWLPLTEAMLMSASRHEHVEKVLRPALADGKIVISDRYNDSTRVYQGLVGGVPTEDINALNRLACGGLLPDLTILLDMEVAKGLRRASDRNSAETRFESKGANFHELVREGFLTLARQEQDRYTVIDASGDIDTIHSQIATVVNDRFGSFLGR